MKSALFSLLLIASVGTQAWAKAPELSQDFKAASSYLRMLNEGKFDIAGSTALSPNCELSRRKEIREQLEFYRKTSLNRGDAFILEEKKTDGKFMALLLRSKNPTSPLTTRIHAIAMLQRDQIWRPAPLPGSFSNTGYGYDPDVEKTVRSLERWMAREKIKRETEARKNASNKLLSEIARREKKAGLENLDPEKAVLLLIEAIRGKDVMQVLAIMGAASGELHEPLETSVNDVSRGLGIDLVSNDWHLVTSRSVIAQVMKVDNTKNEVAVGFWDPMTKTHEKILYFPVFKSGGKTFARLSELLKVALLAKNERWQQRWRHRRGDETDLRKKLPFTIFKNTKASSSPDRHQLLEEVLKIHKSGDFSKLVPLLPRDGEYFSKDENQKKGLQELGSLWKNLAWMKANPLHVLEILEDDGIALAPLQFAKTNRPGEFATVQLWMTKLDDRWHLIPEDILSEFGGKKAQATMRKLKKRLQSIQKEQQEKQSRELMDQVVILTPPLTLDVPAEQNARILLTTFRTLLRTKDTASALARCAVLKGTESAQTLKIFNYAIRGAADHTDQDEFIGISKVGKWLGITLRTTSKSSGVMEYPLYIIVNTPKGGRILIDVDLRHATNKGRELLNAKAWRKLKDGLPKDSYAEVQSLFKAHEKRSLADIEKNKPEDEDE